MMKKSITSTETSTDHCSLKIHFNDYLSMIALTILIAIFLPALIAFFNGKYQNLVQYSFVFILIIFITKKHFGGVSKEWSRVINNPLVISSSFLLLIYTQLSESLLGSDGNSGGSSGSDLAICAAIIAAFATIYNVQRVSKQELTKNRQDWITTVRLETAKIISTFDSFKANYIIYTQFYNTNHDEFISSCKSLVRSCTKLRMFLNPGDTIAPMITAQLDAIVNYCNYYLNGRYISEDSTIKSIGEVDLHKSLMPWVLVLLKAEWERIKDVLESREKTSDGFYSEDVYTDEWGINKCSDKSIIKYRIDKLKKYGLDIEIICNKNIIVDPFLGFNFCRQDDENIKEKLKEMGLVWENEPPYRYITIHSHHNCIKRKKKNIQPIKDTHRPNL